MEQLIKKDGKLWSYRPNELKPVEFTSLPDSRKMAYIANIERLLPEDRSSFEQVILRVYEKENEFWSTNINATIPPVSFEIDLKPIEKDAKIDAPILDEIELINNIPNLNKKDIRELLSVYFGSYRGWELDLHNSGLSKFLNNTKDEYNYTEYLTGLITKYKTDVPKIDATIPIISFDENIPTDIFEFLEQSINDKYSTPSFYATLTEKVMYQYMLNMYPDLIDLNIENQHSPIDWYSPSTDTWIEYKQRHTHYVGLTIEKNKYDHLIQKEKSFYLNSTPEGIFFFPIKEIDEPCWDYKYMNDTTYFGHNDDVNKLQGEIYIGKSINIKDKIFK